MISLHWPGPLLVLSSLAGSTMPSAEVPHQDRLLSSHNSYCGQRPAAQAFSFLLMILWFTIIVLKPPLFTAFRAVLLKTSVLTIL